MEGVPKKRKHSGIEKRPNKKKQRTQLDPTNIKNSHSKHHKDNHTNNSVDIKSLDVKTVDNGHVKHHEVNSGKTALCSDLKLVKFSNQSPATHLDSSAQKRKKRKKKHKKSPQKKDANEQITEKEKEAKKVKTKKVYGPVKAEDISSNWEQFKMILEKDKSSKTTKRSKSNTKSDKNKTLPTKPQDTEEKPTPEIWFDDVDDIYLETNSKKSGDISGTKEGKKTLVQLGSYTGLTKTVAMDCEMVGVGENGRQHMLARVSIVNQYGQCVYDHFVKPQEKVTDYRTHVSGVRRGDMESGKTFAEVCKAVSDIIKGRILVGHAIQNDLKVLYLSHPRKNIRDTSRYKPFRQLFDGRNPSLKKLTAKVLNIRVQEGEHSSVQDAQAAMRLYTMHKAVWEKELSKRRPFKVRKKSKKTKLKPEALELDDSD